MSEPHHVLMWVENLPVPFDRRVWMEATSLQRAGYEVSVVCPKGNYPLRERLAGIEIYRYPLPSMGGVIGHVAEYAIALALTLFLSGVIMIRHRVDVIHAANPPDLFFLVAMLFKPFGVAFVFDHHDLVPESCMTRFSGLLRRAMVWVSSLAERATFALADIVISTNQSYRAIAIRRGSMRDDRVFVVRSGPRKDLFIPVAADPRLKRGFEFMVAYLGVMGPEDGLKELAEILNVVILDHGKTNILFVLIGEGDERPALMRRTTELGLSNQVLYTGRIPDADLKTYLCTAEVVVAPDPRGPQNDVSTMNKIVEYMALGKAIVSFDLPETVVTAASAAVYAADNDAQQFAELIVSLIEDPARRKDLETHARNRFLSELAWETQEPNLLAAYSALKRQQKPQ